MDGIEELVAKDELVVLENNVYVFASDEGVDEFAETRNDSDRGTNIEMMGNIIMTILLLFPLDFTIFFSLGMDEIESMSSITMFFILHNILIEIK
ncbi:hypothetical protein E2562_022933 [Oryza meyeriana var. granulata]|uniref:Uncharacterized protein n=1 Tax=Oryza meyeriana var. granulata TaxID=110450 RepID=A0A6G1D707_9ORYZ|nr:hypothetical protein E2562_022933 [Oryza meyeriana var. granulata]